MYDIKNHNFDINYYLPADRKHIVCYYVTDDMIFTKQIYNFEQIVVDITDVIYDVHKTNGIHYPFPFCCDRNELIKKYNV